VTSKQQTIIVTGANGFIGSALVAHLAEQGNRIIGFVRNPPTDTSEVRYVRYSLGDEVPEAAFEEAHAIVHCAFVRHGRIAADSDQINLGGTRDLLNLSRRHNTKFVFLSSIAAAPDAMSHYGRHKHAIEGMFDLTCDLVLQPGLVIGNGGLAKQMATVLRSRVIPLLDSGRQSVQPVTVADLVRVISQGINAGISGRFRIADSPTTMKSVYDAICERIDTKPFFIPVPIALMLPMFRIGEALRLPMPFSTENLLGLKGMKMVETGDDLQPFGITLEDYRIALAALEV
jgi:nucleoside-diphosphate-sugar epimerase